jgi:hypothetical protein
MGMARLLLNLLNLRDTGRLGLTTGKGHRVKVALVRPRKAPILAGGLLPGQARADGALLEGDLGNLGDLGLHGRIRILGLLGDLGELNRTGHVLDDKLLRRKVVINCDAGKEF